MCCFKYFGEVRKKVVGVIEERGCHGPYSESQAFACAGVFSSVEQ